MKRILFLPALLLMLFVATSNTYANANIKINSIFYDGSEPRSEGDEYIELINLGNTDVNIGGFGITANDGQRFVFPSWATIRANDTCRVYTNRQTGGTCSFSWNSNSARWNNDGDCGKLFDASGIEIDQLCYEGGSADDTTITRPTTPSEGGNTPPPAGSTGQPCPPSGAWPPGCVPGGSGGGNTPAPANGTGQPCPPSGAWPPGCVPGGSGGGNTPPAGGAGQPCPSSGAWPPGCVPGGSGGGNTPPAGGAGQPCPPSGAWPPGCVPNGGGQATPLYTSADAEQRVGDVWRVPFDPSGFECFTDSSTYPTIPEWHFCDYEFIPFSIADTKVASLYAGVASDAAGAQAAHNEQIRRMRSSGNAQVEDFGSFTIGCFTQVVDGITSHACLRSQVDRNMNVKALVITFDSLQSARQLILDFDL